MEAYSDGVTAPLKAPKNYPTRVELAARDGGWVCFYCSVPLVDDLNPEHHVTWVEGEHTYRRSIEGRRWAEVDHVLPRSRGGSNNLVNLVLACGNCNNRKGSKTPGEWVAA